MTFSHPRLQRESTTIQAMIRLYCQNKKHAPSPDRADHLCEACGKLMDYANLRLQKCPFQEGKTTCVQCPVHCYKPEMRAQVREVMRSSGPHMIYRHPVLAVWHILDGRRKEPVKKKNPNRKSR